MNPEADCVSKEDLKAAADMYDSLMRGDFYQKQKEAEEWLRNRAK